MLSINQIFRFCFPGIIFLQLVGCSSTGSSSYSKDCAPNFHIDVSKIPNAVPKVEPLSKYGNPTSYVACGQRYYVMKSSLGYDEKGIASWYGMKFYKFKTSSGEPYDVAGMTAASRVLPLPTYCLVTNLENGKRVIVKVNDRGPFVNNRIMDLSYVAACKLGVYPKGTALVEVKAIDPRNPSAAIDTDTCTSTTYCPPTETPELFLQIGAFGQPANAESLKSKIQTYTSYPVYIKPVDKNGVTLYKVQIGPINTVDESDALSQTLQNAGLGKAIAAVQ